MAVEFIKGNYEDDITLQKAADGIFVSAFYLSHLFRRENWKVYTGSDKNVAFSVFAYPVAGVIGSWVGTVTVDFTNGKGSGVVPD